MWGSAVECRQRGGSAAPRHAARGAVGVFNQVDKFMGSEPWLRGSFVLSPPPQVPQVRWPVGGLHFKHEFPNFAQ